MDIMMYKRSGRVLLIFSYIVIQFYGCLSDGDSLILMQAVFRHGDRSPAHSFPNDRYNYTWPQGLGQLTQEGMQQAYNLGKFLRDRYGEDKFLSKIYNQSEIYVRSTDVDRTLMSAYCVLAGLYPPDGNQVWNKDIKWQPIPVHTEPTVEDYLLRADTPCPKFNELKKEFFSSEIIRNYTKNHQTLIDKAAKLSGLPPTLQNLIKIVDPLHVEYIKGKNLSEWQSVLPREKILQLSDDEAVYIFYTQQMARLRGGPLLGHMINNMEKTLHLQASTVTDSPKVFLFSAHDTTLIALLRAMKVFNMKSPVYTSCILVELWNPSITGQPYVRVVYRNETDSNVTYTLQVPGCGVKCPLVDFTRILQNNIPTNISKECNPQKPPGAKSDSKVAVVVLGCLVAMLVAVVAVLIILRYKNRRNSFYRPVSTTDDDDD